jgi:ABC-type antimicrobial peptide transport system permease subunit
MTLMVRTSRTIEDFAPDLRATLGRLHGLQSVQAIRPFEEAVWNTLNPRAFASTLLAVCTALALAVAVLGVYAVTAHVTATQTKEIAIRVALGASPTSILRVAVGGTMRLVCVALVLGAAGAYGVARAMSSALFGIAPFDPLTYSVAAITLGIIAALAAVAPARRALHVDPLVSLRVG